MKNKLVRLYLFISGIDRRYIQAAYFAFTLIAMAVMSSPDDGTGSVH